MPTCHYSLLCISSIIIQSIQNVASPFSTSQANVVIIFSPSCCKARYLSPEWPLNSGCRARRKRCASKKKASRRAAFRRSSWKKRRMFGGRSTTLWGTALIFHRVRGDAGWRGKRIGDERERKDELEDCGQSLHFGDQRCCGEYFHWIEHPSFLDIQRASLRRPRRCGDFVLYDLDEDFRNPGRKIFKGQIFHMSAWDLMLDRMSHHHKTEYS